MSSDRLVMVSFRLSPGELDNLDYICQAHRVGAPIFLAGQDVNRTSIVRLLIGTEFNRIREEEQRVQASLDAAMLKGRQYLEEQDRLKLAQAAANDSPNGEVIEKKKPRKRKTSS